MNNIIVKETNEDGTETHQATCIVGGVRLDALFETEDLAQEWARGVGNPAALEHSAAKALVAEQRRQLVILARETCGRLGELLWAQWDEFDPERRIWIVPSRHNKYLRARGVLLSQTAIDALCALHAVRSSASPRVFSELNPRATARHFQVVCKELGFAPDDFPAFRRKAMVEFKSRNSTLGDFELAVMLDTQVSAIAALGAKRGAGSPQARRERQLVASAASEARKRA